MNYAIQMIKNLTLHLQLLLLSAILLTAGYLLLRPAPTQSQTSACLANKGLGIFTNGNANNYISQVKPDVVLLLDNFSYASQIPSSTLVVGRNSALTDGGSDNSLITLNNALSQMSHPNIDVIQGYNEPLANNSDNGDFSWLTTHDHRVIDIAKNMGKAVCLGNFKEGYPQNINSAFQAYAADVSSYAASQNVTAYLCVHEHESATSNSGTWTFGNRYNGRFTQLRPAFTGIPNIPVIVTVAGFDGHAGPGDTINNDGWNGTISPGTYLQMLLSYQSAAKSAGAAGVAVFQVGLGGTWDSFDISPLLNISSTDSACTSGGGSGGGGSGGGGGGSGECTADFTKIGVFTDGDPETPAYLQAKVDSGSPVPVMVVMNDWNYANTVKSISPQTLVVGRQYFSQYESIPDWICANPTAGAAQWMADHGAVLSSNVDYWEGVNEPIVDSPERMRCLAQFEAERVRLLAQQGKKACIGNFSVGNPNPDLWPDFRLAFEAAANNNGIICLHEYGNDASMAIDGYRLGRFTHMYTYLDSIGLGNIQTVISEFGLDTGGCATCGWRHNSPDAATYLSGIAGYDKFISGDNRIIGATIFAIQLPDPKWATFDISGEIINAMINGAQNPGQLIPCPEANIHDLPPGWALPPELQMQSCTNDENHPLSSRPAVCGFCEAYVPRPVKSCAGNFIFSNTLKYNSFEGYTCREGDQCTFDDSACTIQQASFFNCCTDMTPAERLASGLPETCTDPCTECGDLAPRNCQSEAYKKIPVTETENLIVGPKPWYGRFTLDATSVIQPYMGNDYIPNLGHVPGGNSPPYRPSQKDDGESREMYVADYFDGTIYYDSPIKPESHPPAAEDDPFAIFSPANPDYYNQIRPFDPRFWSYTGVVPKISPQIYLDRLKIEALEEVGLAYLNGRGSVNITIRSWAGDKAKLLDFDISKTPKSSLDLKRVKPLPPGENTLSVRGTDTWDQYLEALERWKTRDSGKWFRLWSYIPTANRQDSPFQFFPVPQQPAAIIPVIGDTGGAPPLAYTLPEAEASDPKTAKPQNLETNSSQLASLASFSPQNESGIRNQESGNNSKLKTQNSKSILPASSSLFPANSPVLLAQGSGTCGVLGYCAYGEWITESCIPGAYPDCTDPNSPWNPCICRFLPATPPPLPTFTPTPTPPVYSQCATACNLLSNNCDPSCRCGYNLAAGGYRCGGTDSPPIPPTATPTPATGGSLNDCLNVNQCCGSSHFCEPPGTCVFNPVYAGICSGYIPGPTPTPGGPTTTPGPTPTPTPPFVPPTPPPWINGQIAHVRRGWDALGQIREIVLPYAPPEVTALYAGADNSPPLAKSEETPLKTQNSILSQSNDSKPTPSSFFLLPSSFLDTFFSSANRALDRLLANIESGIMNQEYNKQNPYTHNSSFIIHNSYFPSPNSYFLIPDSNFSSPQSVFDNLLASTSIYSPSINFLNEFINPVKIVTAQTNSGGIVNTGVPFNPTGACNYMSCGPSETWTGCTMQGPGICGERVSCWQLNLVSMDYNKQKRELNYSIGITGTCYNSSGTYNPFLGGRWQVFTPGKSPSFQINTQVGTPPGHIITSGVDILPIVNLECGSTVPFTVVADMLSGNKGEACGCPKIQAINCTITIDKKTCQPKGTCDAAEPPPPGPPSCGLPPLGSVPSCSGEIRNDPGDALCGQETYDLIVQPGEMFWQANPFPMEFTDTNSITLPGDAAHQYNTTRCAADMACLQCNCVPDDIMCDQQLGSKTVTCSDYPGCTRTVPTHDYACSAAGSTGDSLSHDQQSDAKCNPPKHPESPLCGERMACWGPNDADGSACCIKPYGADDFISGGPICRQAASQFPFRSLTYTAQREIHLATNLPYYGNIRDRLIQPIAYKEVSVYTRRKPLFAGIIRLFTPYRGADTAPDAVPWYDFHDGDASGWLTIKDPIDPQFGNPVSLSTTRTPFFFPLLGGIQDATSFMRDCLTSAAVYDPTTGITANGCNYSDLSAPNAGNRTPGSGTATNTCTPDPLNPNLCQGLIPDYPLTQMTYNLGALSSSTVELTLVVPEIINYLNQNPIDIIAFQEVDNYFGNNAFTLLESYLKTNNYDYRFMGRKGAGGALQQQHDTGGLLFISRYPISNYQDLTFDVGSYTYPVQGITITYNGQQISYLNHHRPSHTDKCDSLSQLLPKINAYGTADKIVLGDFNAEINECSGFFSNFTDHCPSCTGTKEENGSTADHILGSGIVKNPAAAGIISQLTASDHKAIYSQILFKQESLDESQAIADALAAVTSGNITPPLNYPTCLDINVPNVGDIVTAGQPIAGVDPNGANHPCSTIDHLHFGITENNTFINPASYLKSNNAVVWSLSGSDQPFNFTGSWSWPIDTSVIQGFGNTYLAQQGFYISGAHNGIDMRPSSNSVISAPLDGKFLLHETQCKGQPLTFVILDHGGGVKSWYTHVTLNQCNSTFSGTTCQQACDTFNPGSTAICEFSAPGGPVPVQAGNAYCAARNSAKPNCYCN